MTAQERENLEVLKEIEHKLHFESGLIATDKDQTPSRKGRVQTVRTESNCLIRRQTGGCLTECL